MFEHPRLSGTPKRSIVVQTRAGANSDLTNFVAPAPDSHQQGLYEALRKRYGSRWENRKPVESVYNCAGMAWANRRTCLTEPAEWRRILSQDEYRQTNESDVRSGDIVLYVRLTDGEIMHVARFVDFRHEPPAGLIPWAISKWNLQSGEDLHRIRDVPPLNGGERWEIEFWTDRPARRRRALAV